MLRLLEKRLSSGFHVLDDVTNRNMTIRDALKNRENKSADNLKRKALERIDKMMTGSGYKKRRTAKKRQSRKKRVTVKRLKKVNRHQKKKKPVKKRVNKKKNKLRSAYDIFTS